VANLCCGFDIMGIALSGLYDVMKLTKRDEPGISIKHIDRYNLPENPAENVAGVALQAMMDAMKYANGFDVVIDKQIKPGSGIGSSAASATGIVVAANELLGKPFSKKELVSFAMEGEALASGSRHADNLAPCIFGGLTLIRETSTLDIIELPIPPMYVNIIHPQIEIKTSYARQILPKEVPLKSAITQWANVAGLIAGFIKSDYGLISRSLNDVIVEPVRSKLIPGFDQVKKKSIEAGALGGGIAGSGPSLFMFSENIAIAQAVEEEMKTVYQNLGIEYKTYITTIGEGIIVESLS
jgi:homoserine kinase